MKTLLCTAAIVLASSFVLGQQYKVLYSFTGAQIGDGAYPVSNLVFDQSGNLYGTTLAGGANAVQGGVVFELSPAGGTWTETILYNFCSDVVNGRCLDGRGSQGGPDIRCQAAIFMAPRHTVDLIAIPGPCSSYPLRLSPPGWAWTETVLYSFCANYGGYNCLDGALTGSANLRLTPPEIIRHNKLQGGSGPADGY